MDIDWKSVIAGISAIVSIIALRVSWWLWRETNRPIITVEINADGGNEGIAYHLVVHNCGNRPAAKIRLSATSEAKDAALTPNASESAKEQLYSCFSAKYEIPLLRHGERIEGGFGTTSRVPVHNELVYGALIPVAVRYEDLVGNTYKTNITVVIRDTKAYNDSWYQ